MKEKDLHKFLAQPQTVRFSKIENILSFLGYQKRQGKGSHVIFFGVDLPNITVAIHNHDCSSVAKKAILKTLQHFNLLSK